MVLIIVQSCWILTYRSGFTPFFAQIQTFSRWNPTKISLEAIRLQREGLSEASKWGFVQIFFPEQNSKHMNSQRLREHLGLIEILLRYCNE